MFWFRRAAVIYISALFFGCTSGEKAPETENTFFSLKSFFDEEISRLQQENPRIQKTVSQDGTLEAKDLTINDWKNELNLFIESDINKPSWKTSYSERKTKTATEYIAQEEGLRTKKIRIEYRSGSVSMISIENEVNNVLYSSNERLYYYPDSIYRIYKRQNVKIIVTHQYTIEGKFRP